MILYFHIPFCASKCGYCAFNSFTQSHNLIPKYFTFLTKQLKTALMAYNKPFISSVFFGGGTPSIAESKHYAPIFELITPFLIPGAEITLEANPDFLLPSWLEDLVSFGANRVSFGVQSFNAQKLRFLERKHDSREIYNTLNSALKSGFSNINIDLMYGTPFDTLSFLNTELQIALNLPLTHMSFYCLSFDEGSRFARKAHFLQKIASLQNDLSINFAHTDNNTEQQAHFIVDFLQTHGFKRYEVSNFAKQDIYKCNHNLSYWKYRNCLAFGAGAVGFDTNAHKTRRFFYPPKLQDFFSEIPPIIEELSPQEILLERLFLGFRSEVGVLKALLSTEQLHKANHLLHTQKIWQNTTHFYATEFLLGDELALYLWEN